MARVDWQQKVKAFLYTPPDAALLPSGDSLKARRQALYKIALGGDDHVPDDLAQADAIAWALEKPPGLDAVTVDFAQHPQIRHPFSGERLSLWEPPADLDVRAHVQATVNQAIQELRRQYRDDEMFFLALWRLLPEELAKKDTFIGNRWEFMPADPRLPDSVWAHAAVTSAVATAGLRPAFLIFTIASTQEFVAQARRTQDLWMGSFLLSYLIWEAIRTIVEDYGPDVILSPALRAQPLVDLWLQKKLDVKVPSQPELQVASFPNLFTAILPEAEATSAAEKACQAVRAKRHQIFEQVKEYIEKAAAEVEPERLRRRIAPAMNEAAWQSLWATLCPRLKNLGKDETWHAIWQRQELDFLEHQIFWVVLPWGDDPDAALSQIRPYLPENRFPDGFEDLYQEAARKKKHVGFAYAPLSGWTGRLLTTCKNLRHFRQSDPESGEPGHRCSLCGIREALHPSWQEESAHFRELTLFWEVLSTVTRKGDQRRKLAGRIRPGDRLCAVCVTKRLALEAYFTDELGLDHHMFPSTSTVATAAFQEDLITAFLEGRDETRSLYDSLEAYISAISALPDAIMLPSSSLPRLKALTRELTERPLQQPLNEPLQLAFRLGEFLKLDGDWLFEESFDPAAVERQYGEHVNQNLLKRARRALQDLLKAAEACGMAGPTPYYAVIHMDGDRMGDWVNGRYNLPFSELLHPEAAKAWGTRPPGARLMGVTRPMGPGAQAALRNALRDFAVRSVRQIVEVEHCGKLIYAGGDDLLALAPLRDVPGILLALHRRFVSSFAEEQGRVLILPGSRAPHTRDSKERSASISAGVVIVHRSHPFSQAIEFGQLSLKNDAKDRLGRDAFAFRLLKRSGAALVVGCKWQFPNGTSDPPLEILQRLVAWFQEGALSPRLARFMAVEAAGLAHMPPTYPDPLAAELRRLVNRHATQDAGRIADTLVALLEGYRDLAEEITLEKTPWEMTKDFVLLAHFIAKEGK